MNYELIESEKSEKLALFKSLSEPQLKHFFEPNGGLFIAESEMIITRALDKGIRPYAWLVEEDQLDEYKELIDQYPDSKVYVGNKQILNQITGFNLARGIACAMIRPNIPSLEDILSKKTVAILENVMNPTNVGAIFRSAAALGIEAIILTEGCSDPLYRRAARVSMGTVFTIPWLHLGDADISKSENIGKICENARCNNTRCDNTATPNWISILKQNSFSIIGMALSKNSLPIDYPVIRELKKKAIVLGTESTGITDVTLSSCDYIVKIPMYNGVDSLNVAAASAVAFWELSGRVHS